MRFLMIAIAAATIATFAGSAAAEDDLVGEARTAIKAFVDAVRAGPEATAPLLAPEYQIMRANGVGHDRESYLARGTAQVSIAPDFAPEDLVVTTHDDLIVVRFFMRVEGTVDGEPMLPRSPRLAVFRKIEDQWKVVAYANFGATK